MHIIERKDEIEFYWQTTRRRQDPDPVIRQYFVIRDIVIQCGYTDYNSNCEWEEVRHRDSPKMCFSIRRFCINCYAGRWTSV